MTAIGTNIAEAWKAGKKRVLGNTYTDGTVVWLYDKAIAWREPDGTVMVCCPVQSHTTVSRLNDLPGVGVHTERGQLFLNGRPWNGKPTKLRPAPKPVDALPLAQRALEGLDGAVVERHRRADGDETLDAVVRCVDGKVAYAARQRCKAAGLDARALDGRTGLVLRVSAHEAD